MTSDKIQAKVEDFFSSYPTRRFAKGETMLQAGQKPDGIYFVSEGQVRQYDISEKGDIVVVNIFNEGAFFAMTWALNNSPNRYFFDAFEAVSLRVAPVADVKEFLNTNQDVTLDLLRRITSGAEGLQRRMAHLMGGSAWSRLLFEVIIECQRHGTSLGNGGCQLNLNEEELANRIGITRETVSRELNKLKKEGLIEVKRTGITIKNLSRIEEELGDQL